MKTYDEMVNSLLERREQYLFEQKLKRKNALGIAYAGGCCAVAAAVIGAGVYNSGILKQPLAPDSSPAASDEPNESLAGQILDPKAPDFSSVIWAEGVSELGEIRLGVDYEMSDFYGKRIFPSISEAFEKYGDEEVFAIAADCGYYDMNFVYNGKTLAQYEAEETAIWDNKEKFLHALLKFGDSLKYGEALITTGTPDGEKWDEELYYRTVSEFGEELLSEYIVDGEFLKDKLEQDIRYLDNERMALQQSFEQGCDAYRKNIFESAAEQIKAQGIYCETLYSSDGSDSPYSLVIFVTKDEFAALTFDGMQKWVFAMANKIVINEAYRTVPYISTSD